MKNILKTAIPGLTLLISLGGCTTVGNKFDIAKADQLQPGRSTMSEAVQLLGPPTAQSTGQNNATLLQWQYSQGTLVGASGAHLAVLFGPDGKMVRVTHKFGLSK